MPHKTLTLIWAGGLAFAVLIYAIGPDDILTRAWALADWLAAGIENTIMAFSSSIWSMIRALAIACFAIFFALCIVASGRGLRPGGTLVTISILFLLLVWHQGPEARVHWLLAFILTASAAANISRRLAVPWSPPRGEKRF